MSYELRSTFASLPFTTRGIPIVLGADPKGKNFLYVNGNSVIIRDLANPSVADVYSEHSVGTTVAKYSPSGFYIASADKSGKVRIWDTTQKEHILKNEFQPFAGPVKDLSWSGDNQRIVAGGEGREKFGHVFNADTGTSVGEIMGQSKAVNSVDFRSQRPFRIVTASEDNSLAFFHGPPFKFQFTIQDHTKFANCVRYSPDGNMFVSGGADGRCFLYDGKTGEKTGELGDPAHKGGVYAVCFSPDSKQIVTSSGDKTAKIWNADEGTVFCEFTMGSNMEDMQVGNLWQGEFIISVSVSGAINYLDKNNPGQPWRIIKGHNKPITAMALSDDKHTILTGSSDGGVCRWDTDTGNNDLVHGKGHRNQIQDIAVCDDAFVTCSMDDSVCHSSIPTSQYGEHTKMPSMPKGVSAASGGLTVVACVNEVCVMRHGKLVYTEKVSYEPTCAAIHPGKSEVAIGGGQDNKVHVYSLDGDTLQEKHVASQLGSLTALRYSPDGGFLAAADTTRRIVLYTMPDYEVKISSEWTGHTARVNSLSWTPDSLHLASGGLDTCIIVWNPAKKMNYTVIKAAHPQSQVTRVEWIDNNSLISCGQDSAIRKWAITHN